MNAITKKVESIGDNLVLEYEDKHSIELGQTAKGEWYVKSLKIYANSAYDMLDLA